MLKLNPTQKKKKNPSHTRVVVAILPTVATNYVLGAYLSRYNIHPQPLPQKKGPSSSTWTRCHLSSVFPKKKEKKKPSPPLSKANPFFPLPPPRYHRSSSTGNDKSFESPMRTLKDELLCTVIASIATT